MLETVTPFGWTRKTLWWNENDPKVVVLYLREASPSYNIFSCCYLDEWHFRLIIILNVVLALITWEMIVSCIRYCTPVYGYVDSKSIHWDCVKGKGLKGGVTKADDGSLEFFCSESILLDFVFRPIDVRFLKYTTVSFEMLFFLSFSSNPSEQFSYVSFSRYFQRNIYQIQFLDLKSGIDCETPKIDLFSHMWWLNTSVKYYNMLELCSFFCKQSISSFTVSIFRSLLLPLQQNLQGNFRHWHQSWDSHLKTGFHPHIKSFHLILALSSLILIN